MTIALTVKKKKLGTKIFKRELAQKLTRTPLNFFVPFDDEHQHLQSAEI
jgi:hypothetical protein